MKRRQDEDRLVRSAAKAWRCPEAAAELAGSPIVCVARSTASTAPSDTPGARSKETSPRGTGLVAHDQGRASGRARSLATDLPAFIPVTMSSSRLGVLNSDATSSTTRYWFSCEDGRHLALAEGVVDVSSITWGEMPKRAAVARSIATTPAGLRPVRRCDVAAPGDTRSVDQLRRPTADSTASASSRLY